MANPPQKTGVPQSAGNPTQPSVAVGQVASGGKTAGVTGSDSATETDEQLAKAWGFSVRRPKLSRETAIGLVAIVALLGLFGFVAAKIWRNRSAVVAEKTEKADPNVTQAGGTDPFDENTPVMKTQFEESDGNAAKGKKLAKDLDLGDELAQNEPAPKAKTLEDDTFDVGAGQSEPGATKTTSRKRAVADSGDSDVNPFGDDEPNRAATPRNLDRNNPLDQKNSVPADDFETEQPALTRN